MEAMERWFLHPAKASIYVLTLFSITTFLARGKKGQVWID